MLASGELAASTASAPAPMSRMPLADSSLRNSRMASSGAPMGREDSKWTRARLRRAGAASSHGVRGFVPAESAGEIVLDLLLRLAAVLIAELHADARSALALRAFRRHPDHASGHRQLLILTHEIE